MLRLTTALLFLTASGLRADELAKKLEAVMDDRAHAAAHWGVLAVNSHTGEVVYARNADKMFAPASVTKLYSCAAALVALGPDHRFVTPVYARGKVEDGRLAGDLVLVAQGDLTFGGRTGPDGKVHYRDQDHTYAGPTSATELTDTNPVAALEDLAKQVKAAGITRVVGDVVIDDRLFQPAEGSGSGPKVVSPVIVNDNVIDVTVEPAKSPGKPATVHVRPETAYAVPDFDVTTGPAGGSASLTITLDDARTLLVRGSVPAGGKSEVRIAGVPRPAEFARTLFVEALKRAGVRVEAPLYKRQEDVVPPPAKEEYAKLKKVAAYTSPPLRDAITVTLKVSHNLYASTLPLLVGAKKGATTARAGLREQGRVLKEIGIDPADVSFAGGAGGANADHVSPRVTVKLLQCMAKRPEWEAYKAALPVLGKDGTLAVAVPADSPARGKAFAKTGTLYWDDAINNRSFLTSKALAGVMTTKAGAPLTFAMFVNGVPLPRGVLPSNEGKVLGKLCEILYDAGP